jgi:hypothetical protein
LPQTKKYNVYRGKGGVEDVDFSCPVGSFAHPATTASLAGLGHDAGSTYTYVVRPESGPAGNTVQTPDLSCAAAVAIGPDGQWVGNRPAPVSFAEAEVRAGGVIRLRWRYRTPDGRGAPEDFAVWHDTDPAVDTAGDPDHTVAYTADGYYTHDVVLAEGAAWWFKIAARGAGGAASEMVRVGPYKPRAAAPAAPAVLTKTGF